MRHLKGSLPIGDGSPGPDTFNWADALAQHKNDCGLDPDSFQGTDF